MKCMFNSRIDVIRWTDGIAKLILLVFALQDTVFSQDGIPTLPPGVSPSSMSSSQINSYEQQAKQSGYSQQQIDAAKKQYGLNESQKPDIKGTEKTNLPEYDEPRQVLGTDREEQTGKEKNIEIGPDSKSVGLSYFGYSIFGNVPDAFKPNAVGPVDPGYLVGPGDVLRLSVWGQVEFQYELTVNKEGKIFIPVAGQVYVTGVPFETLQNKIKNLLSKHYSGLSTTHPRTFMDLSVAQLRPLRIFIMGEVSSPGGYTISSYATTFNALYSIGGPLTRGSLRNIQVLRNGKEIATVDIYEYLLEGKCTTDVKLQNNDVIFIPGRGKTVSITGSVFRPGIYELKDGDNLQALLSYSGGIPPNTNVDRSQVYRVLPFDQRKPANAVIKVVDLDLRKYLNKKEDFVLYDRDSIEVIPLLDDMRNFVRLSGAVSYPGVYQCDTLGLKDLVFGFGKPVENIAYMKRADLIRFNEDFVTTSTIPIDLIRLKGDPSYDYPLQPGDEVIVYEKEVAKAGDLKVIVEGEVRKPDTISMSTNMTLTDALLRAGGFTREAYRKSVDIYRIDRTSPDSFTTVFRIDLPDSLKYVEGRGKEIVLQDRDRIIVREDPDYITDNFVIIKGLVKLQGKYAIRKRGDRLSDVIDRAGGLQPDAFLKGATVTRGDKRLVVDFEDAYTNKKSKENILLQKGDEINIPLRPNTVYVYGNVNNPGLLSFVNGSRVKEYIDRAGGFADSSNYILYKSPEGETKKVKIRGLGNPKVLDGSDIRVVRKPPRVERENEGPSITEVIRDTLAIITSAVTVIVLVVQLKK